MTTLYHFAANVKPASFGKGILASRPTYHATYTAGDDAWRVEDNARREAENRHYDALYADREAERLVTAGHVS